MEDTVTAPYCSNKVTVAKQHCSNPVPCNCRSLCGTVDNNQITMQWSNNCGSTVANSQITVANGQIISKMAINRSFEKENWWKQVLEQFESLMSVFILKIACLWAKFVYLAYKMLEWSIIVKVKMSPKTLR